VTSTELGYLSGVTSNIQTQIAAVSAGATYWDKIVGMPAHVTAGKAQYTSINTAIAAASTGEAIKVLPGTYTENVSVDKQLHIEGSGRGTLVAGTWTWTDASDYSDLENLKATSTITFNTSTVGIQMHTFWVGSGASVVDNSGLSVVNFYQGIYE
jgi:pectin methylesterase-like acyl-CoA thioesterase